MTISIVIPTYNGEKFVGEAIECALAQSRPADEIIVSDDNSKDGTIELCKTYGDRIKIFRNENGPSGFVNGWNNAIAHASGEFITILHQDDLLAPTFLEEMERAIIEYPEVKHFFAPCNYIDGEGNISRIPLDYCSGKIHFFSGKEYANAYVRYKHHIHRCPGVITHRDIFKICRYRECAGHIADDDFFIRVGQYTDVVGVLKPLASYREHASSETGHLPFLSINRRLLNDYHFQLNHKDESPLIGDEIEETFTRWETEYIHRLTIYGLKSFKLNYVGTALKNWFYFDRRDGFRYLKHDFRTLRRYAKDSLRRYHVDFLRRKSTKLFEFEPKGSVLIIAPHPDDEVIGCGGLIAHLVEIGKAPHIAVLTGGEGSHDGCCHTSASEIKAARRQLTRNALGILGVPLANLHEFDFADGDISDASPEMEKLRKFIADIKPNTILVPHWGEGWPDHLAAREIGLQLAPEGTAVWEYCVWMWYYNVWRGLDWRNAAKLTLTDDEHKLKLEAMDAYIKPVAPCGKPWSGNLPQVFVSANSSDTELYFKIKGN